jgi:beta-phosphoglucomutase-like phosphatase (HAD superfamily)
VRSVALEDSSHGVTAAKAAGMVAVAVPGVLTRSHDLSHADLRVESVADLTVPLLRGLVDQATAAGPPVA